MTITAPTVAPMAPTAKNMGRNSLNAAERAVFGRSDGEGKSVMTVDLYGPGGPGSRLESLQPRDYFVPSRRSLHIDAGKPGSAQRYNRFDERFQGFKPA